MAPTLANCLRFTMRLMTEDLPTFERPAKATFGRELRINCFGAAAERINSARLRFRSAISDAHRFDRSSLPAVLCLAVSLRIFLLREHQVQHFVRVFHRNEIQAGTYQRINLFKI